MKILGEMLSKEKLLYLVIGVVIGYVAGVQYL